MLPNQVDCKIHKRDTAKCCIPRNLRFQFKRRYCSPTTEISAQTINFYQPPIKKFVFPPLHASYYCMGELNQSKAKQPSKSRQKFCITMTYVSYGARKVKKCSYCISNNPRSSPAWCNRNAGESGKNLKAGRVSLSLVLGDDFSRPWFCRW